MKIVIDILEEVGVGNIINEMDCLLTDYFNGTYCKITPLQKGHGRLIDADELYDRLIFPTEQFGNTFKEILDDAPTIIKADKGE